MREMFETNFFGAVAAMQAAIPGDAAAGGGTIINISVWRAHPMPFHAAYSATKFAMNAIGKVGVELEKDGIHVLTVCPRLCADGVWGECGAGNELKRVRPNQCEELLRAVRGLRLQDI